MDENDIKKLPELYQTLIELIGEENMLTLAKNFDGEAIYFPKYEAIYRGIRDREIVETFNGGNYKELARKYDLSENHVRKIIADSGQRDKFFPQEGQFSMFDDNK